MNKDVLKSLSRDELISLLLQKQQEQETRVAEIELLTKTTEKLARKTEQQEHRIALLLRQLYGQRRERFIDPDQLTLFDLEEVQALAEEAKEADREQEILSRRRGKKRPGHGRRPLPEHLPREIIRHELSPSERTCPCCGEERAEIGCESSEQLEFIPASFKVLVHERVKYACRACQEHVAIAEVPNKPIAKGLPGPGLMAHTVLSKYGDHLPLYRQEDIVARSGVILRRSTLCDWIGVAAVLLAPLYRRMMQRVLESSVVHTDDTSVKLLDPEKDKAITARFWAYLGDRGHPYIVYDFTDSRRRDGPHQFLANYEGYLQADAYGGYDGIYAGGGVIEVACWAHARRKWDEAKTTDPARSHHALALIQKLYRVEREFRGASAEERLAARQEQSLPILNEFKTWLDAEQTQVLPKSPVGKACTYVRSKPMGRTGALLRTGRSGDRQQRGRTVDASRGPGQKKLAIRGE